jgi:iron complex transport system substrate-binding protein
MAALNRLTGAVVDEALKLHSTLGHGLLETTYECILERALIRRGLSVDRQVARDFIYDGMLFRRAIRLDLLIEGSVVIELKAEAAHQRMHTRQLLTYLRLLNLPLGLLINFGVPHLKDGIHRLINFDAR